MSEDVGAPGADREVIYQHEDLKLAPEQRDKLYHSVLEASRLDPEYLAMLALSALIALLGLLQNSAAVIIGAMLISPLMDPILAAALAVLLGDWKLGRKTAMVLGLSIGGAILITWVVAALVPLKQATPEILARTNPNLLDLFIAFLSGLAGTLALRSGSSGLMIIPGVAIAVAVIPPLAVVGYGLSAGQIATAGGAFLLFFTNLISIILSAAIVFWLVGFRPGQEAERGRLKLQYRVGMSCLILLVLSIPLIQTLRRGVSQVRMRSDISRVLDQAFKTENSSVSDLSFSRRGDSLSVRATLRTTEYFDDKDILAAERALRDNFGQDTRLDVEQILVTHGGLTEQQVARIRNFITGGVVQPAAPPQEPAYDFKKGQDELLAYLQKQLDEIIVVAGAPFRPLGPLRAEVGASQPVAFRVQLGSPEPLEPQTVQVLAAQLSGKLGSPVELHGRVELEGADHGWTIERSDLRRGLTAQDRRAIAQLVGVVASRPDLCLRVTIATSPADSETPPTPLLGRQVDYLLAQSRLDRSRWTIETTRLEPARAGAPAQPAPAATPSPVNQPSEKPAAPVARCDFTVFQEF